MYHTVLLDADNTLFDFDRAEYVALRQTLNSFGLSYTENDLLFYQEQNSLLWKQLEQGTISFQQLQDIRFAPLLHRLCSSMDSSLVNQRYLECLGGTYFLMPDALAVCQSLSQVATLAIVTNGISRVQRNRLRLSPLFPYISFCFVSEEIGYSKPQREFFSFVFQEMGIQTSSNVLMVGDSLTSDMQGGILAGIDCCWYCPGGGTTSLPCRYQISSLKELIPIVKNGI